MKIKFIKAFILFLTAISITSCKNSFSPIVNFKQQYALNCIIRGDTSLQYATIIRSFSNKDFNSKSAFVSGAKLKLNYDGKDYIFRDTASGGTEDIAYYYLKNLKPENGKELKIEADLPDGTILKSSTQTPNPGILIFGGDKTIPPEDFSKTISINWNLYNYSGRSLYYKPFLYIEYSVNNNGTIVKMQKEVPVQYNLENNKNIPVYPAISMNKSVEYSLSAFNTAFSEIEDADSLSNYRILNAKFVLWVFDRNLAAYLLSTQNLHDDFSLRIEAADFTNVEGGFGIFGTFLQYEKNIQLKSIYLILN